MKKKLIKFIKYIVFSIFEFTNYCLTLVFRMRENRVLFYSEYRSDLDGNLGFMYDFLPSEYDKKVVTKFNKNERLGVSKFLKLLYYIATSKYIFIDGKSIYISAMHLRKGQEVVNLFHGCGAYKKVGSGRSDSLKKMKYDLYRNITKMPVSAKVVSPLYAESFNMNEEDVQPIGIPRTDLFFDEDYKTKTKERLKQKYKFLNTDKKVIMFAPTLRGGYKTGAYYNFKKLDLESIYQQLHEDYIFVFKWHPAVYDELYVYKNLQFDYSKYADFYFDASDEREINDLLLMTDVLITDYSSIIFEYGFMKKPIIFYTYDLETYQDARGLYFPFEDYTYGPVVNDCVELIDAIKREETMDEKREAFMERFMSGCKGNSTLNIYNWVFKK